MSCTFSVFNSIEGIPIAWNNLLPSTSHALHTNEIACVEHACIDNTKNYYVITYENEQPVMLSYFQLLHVVPKHFNITESKLQKISLDVALYLVKPTLLVAGNLYRHDCDFIFYKDAKIPSSKKTSLYIATIEHLIQQTKCSGIFVKDVPKDIGKEIEKDKSYTAMDNDISMYMTIPNTWLSFADYEKELKHKYLQRCKKTRKQFQVVVIKELNTDEIIKYQHDIENLYMQVTNKQMVSMGILNKEFFVTLKKIKKEEYKIYGFFEAEKMIAFSSAIVHNQLFDMNYIGIDYEKNQQFSLYFNILFHCLEQAIATKSKKLVLGRTAPEAKAILGCSPENTHGFYKLRNPIVNWFFQRISKKFTSSQGEAWRDRHPFKSTFYA
jgi:predicted N-acyltransferase